MEWTGGAKNLQLRELRFKSFALAFPLSVVTKIVAINNYILKLSRKHSPQNQFHLLSFESFKIFILGIKGYGRKLWYILK